MASFPFGKGTAPDLPEYGHDFLVKARNCYAGIRGFEPIKALSQVTAALPATWRGGGAFTGADGTAILLSGTNGGLYRLTSSAATLVSAGTYSANWFFVQFGDLVICLNGGAPLKYTISSGAGASLGGSPPTCQYGAIVRDFVFLAGNSSNQNRVYWSSIDNAEGWTPGTNQSDIQDLPDGGAITGLAGGEFGLAFQDEAINIFEYQGSPLVFSRRKVASNIGALCHGGIGQHDRKYFFYSRRGFYKFVDGEVVPIGRNRIDRTFRTTYSVSEIVNNLRCTIDPERSLVIWSMPDRLWVYNFDNDMWSDIAVTGIIGITTGRTASLTLEDIAVIYPSIEDVTPSFDDPFWSGGSPMLLIAKSDGILYSFGASDNMEAQFRLPQLELNPGRVSHVRNSRITGNCVSAQVSLDCRARMGDAPLNVVSTDYRLNGEVPIRASGRFIQAEITLPAGSDWSAIQGFDLEATAGGRN
jgi:hypothetical protein